MYVRFFQLMFFSMQTVHQEVKIEPLGLFNMNTSLFQSVKIGQMHSKMALQSSMKILKA